MAFENLATVPTLRKTNQRIFYTDSPLLNLPWITIALFSCFHSTPPTRDGSLYLQVAMLHFDIVARLY